MGHARRHMGRGPRDPDLFVRTRCDVRNSWTRPGWERSDCRHISCRRRAARFHSARALRLPIEFRLLVGSRSLTVEGMVMDSPWTAAELTATLTMWTVMMAL